MSYASEAGTPARTRPGTVTISSYLLYGVAAIQLISTILAFAFLGDMQRVYEDAFAGVEGAAAVTIAFLIGGTLFGLLIGVGLAVLAMFNNRGRNVSRIITWVVGGLFLCCGGFGLVGQLAGGSMNFGGQTNPDMPTNDELQDLLSDALPAWFNAVTIVLGVVGMLALLVALILLALPPSNEFFRKPAAEWQPPAGYQAFPAYPPSGQPAAPPADPSSPPSTPPPPPEDRPGGGA